MGLFFAQSRDFNRLRILTPTQIEKAAVHDDAVVS
jgi:hypothetical protein